jgi:geranylgeranyl diphosphate synthase type I
VTHIAVLPQDALGLARFQLELERALRTWLAPPDESVIDSRWAAAREVVNEFALRPAKRVRPTLLAAGFAVVRGSVDAEMLCNFGVGLELLHAFMLVHDDVADRAQTRRGGPALHVALGGGRDGEALAVVAGDHLYARAMEAMLAAPSPAAVNATRYMLEVCRHTAAGQHLDLVLGKAPLAEVQLTAALKVARLKTARYGFVAPLVCGAKLGGGDRELVSTLERVGSSAGLAYQLRDDVLGLFGDDTVAGKAGGGDFLEAKRTFPLLAAWQRADAAGRARLESLWAAPSLETLPEARAEIVRWGGLAATERVVARATAQARKGLQALPASPVVTLLDGMLASMAARCA